MRRLLFIALASVGVLLAFWVLLLGPTSFWLMYAPRYSQAALAGKTPTEVVRDLGPPDFDPRQSNDWHDEAHDGPLVLGYYRGTAVCRIEFSHGHVVSVRRYGK